MMVGTRYCSFCGKSQHEVERLVVGVTEVAICNGCVGVAAERLDEKRGRREMVAADIGLIEVALFRIQGGGQ